SAMPEMPSPPPAPPHRRPLRWQTAHAGSLRRSPDWSLRHNGSSSAEPRVRQSTTATARAWSDPSFIPPFVSAQQTGLGSAVELRKASDVARDDVDFQVDLRTRRKI